MTALTRATLAASTPDPAMIVGGYAPGTHGIDSLSVMFAELTIVGTRIYRSQTSRPPSR